MPAPAFDLEALPPGWVGWIITTAQDCNAPPDYVAANLIGVSSSVIGNVRRVSPWEGSSRQDLVADFDRRTKVIDIRYVRHELFRLQKINRHLGIRSLVLD